MLSSHLYLGLPCDLLVRGFQLNIFLHLSNINIKQTVLTVFYLYFVILTNTTGMSHLSAIHSYPLTRTSSILEIKVADSIEM